MSIDVKTKLPLSRFRPTVEENRPDILIVLINWDYPVGAVAATLTDLARTPDCPPIALLDQTDQSSSPFFGVLPLVDFFFKAQILRDPDWYTRPLRSGYTFSDFLSQELGYDLKGWEFGSTADPQQLYKLQLGWNLGVTRRVRTLLLLSRVWPIPWGARPYDFHCRLNVTEATNLAWYGPYRRFALQSLREAARGRRCTDWTRTSYARYLFEIASSRVVFSPFGFGEVCNRDYEAVALGSLLVKPSMDHLRTNPDIFVPYETYVPVRWDFSDLKDKCEWCLSHPAEARRITTNARQVLTNYVARGGQFGLDVRRVLDQVACGSLASPDPSR